MTLAMTACFWPLRPHDVFIVSGLCLAGAFLFGAAMSLRDPMIDPLTIDFDDGEDDLGIPARLIPPSPVLGGRAFPESDENEA